jgi:hypothetical protein
MKKVHMSAAPDGSRDHTDHGRSNGGEGRTSVPRGVEHLGGSWWQAWARRLGVMVALAGLGTSSVVTVLGGDPGVEPTRMPQLSGFELADQHGVNHEVVFPREKPLLLAVADRRGAEQVEGWIDPLRASNDSRFDILGVAHLHPAPKFLRGRILRDLQRRYRTPLLLDWFGELEQRLACREGQANVFLVDRHGQVVHHQSGPATPGQLLALRAAIESAVQIPGAGREAAVAPVADRSDRGAPLIAGGG